MATGASSGRVTPPSSSEQEVGCNDRHRFQLELEFVQCLANPHYINWLAQNRYMDDPEFLAYLTYLRYWKRPEYAQFIIYPSCLHFLDLLQQKEFRTNIANTAVKETVHTQQFRFWQFGRVNRMKEQQQLRQQVEQQPQQQQEQPT